MFRYAAVCIGFVLLMWFPGKIAAAEIPIGFHLLDPYELELALPYREDARSLYVTVPLSIQDRRREVWEKFFASSAENRVVPIVRWVTTFENGNWSVPSRKDIVDAVKFMSSLHWPGQRIVVLFNEPNHAAEWGGKVDPEGYAEIALFAANWLKTEKKDYLVLPAGLDNDAPNNGVMMDSFAFMDRMYRAHPDLFQAVDAWTSHSYPNPAFSASVYGKGKNSIRGFEAELAKLQKMTGRLYDVYITETGWKQNQTTARRLSTYYKEAVTRIWNDERVKAVTVFVLKGTSGPFEEFSLLDEDNQPTAQMRALQLALDRE